MAWITITKDHLASTLTGPEISAIEQAALKSGQEDPIEQAIREGVDYVRGFVAACKENRMGPADTVPERLIYPTIDIIAHKVLTRVMITPKNMRHERYKEALATLKCVAQCDFIVEDPTPESSDPAEQTNTYGPPSISAPPARFNRQSQDGI